MGHVLCQLTVDKGRTPSGKDFHKDAAANSTCSGCFRVIQWHLDNSIKEQDIDCATARLSQWLIMHFGKFL